MTPITLVSFLLSLALVDLRHSIARSHTHAEGEPSRMPAWLHALLYRRSPYRYVAVGGEAEVRQDDGGRWYYRSQQRKLMKLEADEAFQMRAAVVAAMAVAAVAAGWGCWEAGRAVWGLGRAWVVGT